MRLSFSLFALLLCASLEVAGAERRTTWAGLPAIILGKRVTADVGTGATVEGNVVSVNSTELRLKVIRSDDARFSPKVEHAIPRQAITRLQLIERGAAGRILGAVAGGVGGFFLAGAIFDRPDHIPIAEAFSGAAAGTAGGLLLGGRIDRRRTTIHLLPD